MEESCDGHCSPTTSPNMMCIQCVSMYWHSEGQQTAGPPSHCKPTASPPHPTLTTEKLVRRCRRKHPHWDKLFKTILHIRQGCRDKTDTRGKHERQSSPSLPPPPRSPPSSGVCVTFTLACGIRLFRPRLCSSSRTRELSWEVPLSRDFSSLTSWAN